MGRPPGLTIYMSKAVVRDTMVKAWPVYDQPNNGYCSVYYDDAENDDGRVLYVLIGSSYADDC